MRGAFEPLALGVQARAHSRSPDLQSRPLSVQSPGGAIAAERSLPKPAGLRDCRAATGRSASPSQTAPTQRRVTARLAWLASRQRHLHRDAQIYSPLPPTPLKSRST